MPDKKSVEELAAEITIAALSKLPNESTHFSENVCEFYRAIFKEISSCVNNSSAD